MSSPPTTVQVIDKIEELKVLRDSFDELNKSNCSPMQHFAWIEACAESFGANNNGNKLNIVVVWSGDKPVAVAPLIRRITTPVPRLEVLGIREMHEPTGFAYRDRNSLNTLMNYLAGCSLPITLRRTPDDSSIIASTKHAYKFGDNGKNVNMRPAESYPYIDLDEKWNEPEKQFNSGRQSDFRRAQRHADKMGHVSYELLTPSPDNVKTLLDEAYQVEVKSWKGVNGSALAVDKKRGDFFRLYAQHASRAGILKIVFMRIDNNVMGMQIAVETNSGFWLLKIGHDEAYSKCSPGTLLMLYTLKYAAERELKSYEFLGSTEPWTLNWTKTLRECFEIHTYPRSICGMTALAYDNSRTTLARIVKQNLKLYSAKNNN